MEVPEGLEVAEQRDLLQEQVHPEVEVLIGPWRPKVEN